MTTKEKSREKYWRNRLSALLCEIREKVGAPDGVVLCLQRSLTKEELASLAKSDCLEQRQLENFAKAVAERSAGDEKAKELVTSAAQEHIGGWKKSRKMLSVPGKRFWMRVRKHAPKQARGRKTKVHSSKIRSAVRVHLLENSTTTAKLMKCGATVEPVYNLNFSRRRLWTRSLPMQRLLSQPAWYKHLAAHHANFVKLKCRTDVCCFCHKYDKVVLPSARSDVELARATVQNEKPDYFQVMDAHWEGMEREGRTDPDGRASLQYVKFLKLFIDRTSDARQKTATLPGTVRARQLLKESEATASSLLGKHVSVLECCSHHFTGVKRQHDRRELLEKKLPKRTLVVQMDFMENMTWPLGPEEAQDWFWATARESMTTLGFYACYWKDGKHVREYWHYISQILNHDSAYAVHCLNDLLRSLNTGDIDELQVWCDTGTHFRSYEFAWNLVEQCREKFPTTVLNFFAAHHGKGYCDGAFGLQRHWVSQYARTRNIECLDHMRAALEEGAQGTMALDPPPDGPAYYVKVFEPSPKTAVNKLDTAKCDLQIEYTYCVLFSRAAVGHVRGWNFVYGDRIDKRSAGKSIGTIQSISTPCSDEWRRSYRATQPEKNPLNIVLLQRRKEKQQAFVDTTCSRRSTFMEALCRRERQSAKQKAKYLRRKRVLAINLDDGGSSSDDSSSDSDS
ncbi:unnamed protein product [Durusdinium trenchii]|uniref:Uncharacterized protein n=1 Tax=Durusdinium trenchii TaxID=1381693 RepID=A0ABP0HQI1_9DINO